ncbi:hypothetical protein HPP92_015166 [Vanilla planifolia]|uniref:PUM-HD domain-containing protein n=1 Tax=Vanilla planifolia TaxID=51239 RepID=A0A835QNZ7_VANPL|nr:hypothetical protein HPP92_015166 [Vanilla planifolia]
MVTEGSVKMASVNLPGNLEDDFEGDIEAMLREQRASFDRERELNIYRSGSAPPTVEGSRNAIGSLFGVAGFNRLDGQRTDLLSEEEMRSHPAYMSYYYSNENLNPRLPPPILSKEDWRAAQRFGFGGSSFGGIGDRRHMKPLVEGDGSGTSLFSVQPIVSEIAEKEPLGQGGVTDWLNRGGGDGLIGLTDVGMVTRKSFTDALQEGLNLSNAVPGHLSRPGSRNAFENTPNPIGHSDFQLNELGSGLETVGTVRSGRTSPTLFRVQSLGSSLSQSSVSAVDPSLARSRTPEPQLNGRSSNSGLPLFRSRAFEVEREILPNGIIGDSSQMTDYVDMAAAFANLNFSKNMGARENQLQGQLNPKSDSLLSASSITGLACNQYSMNADILNDDITSLASNEQMNLQNSIPFNSLSKNMAAFGASSFVGSSVSYQRDMENPDFSESNANSYFAKHGLPSSLNNQIYAGADLSSSLDYLKRSRNQVGSGFQVPNVEPLYAQYLKRSSTAIPVNGNLSDLSTGRNFAGTSSHLDLTGYQKAYLETMLAQQKLQYGGHLNKGGDLNGFYGTPFGVGLPYPSIPISAGVLSSMAPVNPVRQNDRLQRFPSLLRNAMGGSKGSWNPDSGFMPEGYGSSLLEEFKNNKNKSFELSDIVDHVVEFSADQYGSRFIQQKLETASVDEKNKIFPEILAHARALMTDVFGNYVIQKFFEHGTESQRNQLAGQLMEHVLPLSLQMYGCRVIQKALEVVDVDQQTRMVSELDGSIMKCVRDQNGNHVIQKCIECVPQERIKFIITAFYGQVVALSTHPYGCRVIQRVLEHCDDAKTQCIMMEEILHSVNTLAQDQYGNYVVQHVLQHGKPEERSAIIGKLSGQIVKMSQQKFASNVVEKCLTYGSPDERLLLINEMLGSTEENEPLQAMMKDQFANYVVQKVLETCDDRNRELILSRIKVHLNALKRYTYGKHIVARVEKLIAAGERRIGMTSTS